MGMCVRVQWESRIPVSNSGREGRVMNGKAGKGRMEHNEREKGDQHLIDFWRQFFFKNTLHLLTTVTFFFIFLLVLSFPLFPVFCTRLDIQGCLNLEGFFSPKNNKTPLYSFLPLCLFVVDFVCRTSSNRSAERRMGWDGLCGFFLRPAHLPGDISDCFPTMPYTPARVHAGACGTGLAYNQLLSWPIHSRVSG